MEKQVTQPAPKKCRKNERGAALVTVLMISLLLLVVAAALLLEASMNTANVTDATAEEQAYYAAESGIQTVVNVLRGNTVLPVTPVDLRIDTTKSPTDPENEINYAKASKLLTSNYPGDTSTEARLSRWMNYGGGSFSDRVILGDTNPSTYTKQNGLAFKVTVRDPDNLDNKVSFNTSCLIDNVGPSKSWGVLPGLPPGSPGLTITYQQPSSADTTDLDVSSGYADTNFGKFEVTGSGTITERVRFVINVIMTKPYYAEKTIRGFIEKGSIPSTSPADTVKLFYDSQVFELLGSDITLSDPAGRVFDQVNPTIRIGYEVPLSTPETIIRGSISPPEPTRLVIRSTGFGPRGAEKQLEAVIYKNYFDGLTAPSTLLLIGPPPAVFNPGNSRTVGYSGRDVRRKKAHIPPVGVTNDTNLAIVSSVLNPVSFKGTLYGTVSNVANELPSWLKTPTALNAKLLELKEVADASGRYFGPGVPPPDKIGDFTTAKGITFIDGDLDFKGQGGGLLIVTGDLTLNGGFDWNGLVIITGAGGMQRSGGGEGNLQGNMIIAPYNPDSLGDSKIILDGFLPPKYDINGGGISATEQNSNKVDDGLIAISNFIQGVAEK